MSQPGADANVATQVPLRGWWQVLRRAYKESNDDNVSLLAAGVAYYAFLALFPAMIAAVSLWGLILTPARAVEQAESLTRGLPADAASIITEQLEELARQDSGALGLSFVITILLALWSASGGTSALVKAVNLAYDEVDDRGFVKTRLLSLLLTVGAIVFVVLALTLVAAVPSVIDALNLGPLATVAAQVARVALLVVLVAASLAVVYRVAPDREDAKLSWITPGALVTSAVWLLASAGFSLYVTYFGGYSKTYGSIAGVAVLLLWLYITAYVVLFGAEINAEAERQTERDTTTGPDRPKGQRGAYAADHKPEEARA